MIPDFHTVEEMTLEFLDKSELAKGVFDTEAVAAFVESKTGPLKDADKEGLRDKIDEILDSDDNLLKKPDTGKRLDKDVFFKGARFIAAPSEMEMENGVFIPGHRLFPFCNDMVFPSEASIKDGAAVLKTKELRGTLESLVKYHYLMGLESMMDYFIADDPANTDAAREWKPSGEIVVQAFDFAKFYKRHSFVPGDMLLFKVEDRFNGEFSVEALKAGAFGAKEKELWFGTFQSAMGKVCDSFRDYLDIPSQMAQAFFLGGAKLFDPPAMSVEEFMEKTDEIQIFHSGGHSVIGRAGEEEDVMPREIPEGVSVSGGETGSIEGILKDAGSFLKPVHLESYILDELFNGRDSFEALLGRCVGDRPVKFKDAAQEAVFMNFLEDMWETIRDAYPEYKDSRKGLARARALELVDEMNDWFAELDESGRNTKIPKELLKKLSECSLHTNHLLALLNNPKSEFDDDAQYDSTMDSLDDISDIQDSLMEEIGKSLSESKNEP